MLYLQSKYNYSDGSIIDIYVSLDGTNDMVKYEAIAAQHLINEKNSIHQSQLKNQDETHVETIYFSGGELLFIKRSKHLDRVKALPKYKQGIIS